MANNSSGILDKWRKYFSSANTDIFCVLEYAIMVAASDYPYDFKFKRDRIAEMLFTCKVTKCFACDKIELSVPNVKGAEKSEDKFKSGIEAGGSKDSKESKVNSSVDDDHREVNVNRVRDYGYGDAEALTDEIEEESRLFGEVLRIKEILDDAEDQSDILLFDSLRRLQLAPLSVETLKATEIGKSVNVLRKHRSKEVRNLVKTLIGDWTAMVDAWVNATAAIAEAEVETESVKTYAVEEEAGLPSPPLDEGAFFATPTSMELSQFFDVMDDDGNPKTSREFDKNRENGRKPRLEKPKFPKLNLANHDEDSSTPWKDKKDLCKRSGEATLVKQALPCKPNRLLIDESGPGREPPVLHSKPGNGMVDRACSDKDMINKKPMQPQKERSSFNNEASVRMKLEAAKRKLHQRYQEAQNAKKSRTIQVVELHELPKKNLAQANQNARHGNHNGHWANRHHQ